MARKYTTSAIKFPEIPDSESVKAELQKFSNSGKIHRDVIIKESVMDYFDSKLCNKIDLKGKIVIELYPGPGLLTRSILKQDPAGIIPIDPVSGFSRHMQELEECTGIPIEHEMYDNSPVLNIGSVLQDKLPVEKQKLQRETHSYKTMHPNLVMIGATNDEWKSTQLIHHIIESSYHREGWFKYGRFPIYLLLSQAALKKLGKGVKLPWAISSLFDVYLEGIEGKKFEIQPKNFNDKNLQLIPNDVWLISSGRKKVGVLKLVPLEEPKIKAPLYIFTNILFLFGQSKSAKLKSAIKTLDPGSEAVLNLIPQIDPNTKCKDLTLEELDAICIGYLNWYKKAFGKEPPKPMYMI